MNPRIFLLILFSLSCVSQKDSVPPASELEPSSFIHQAPEWTIDKWLYQVNIRQFSEAGTFTGFERHLPRIKQMGIDILYLMPIQAIGNENRQGSSGNYYSIKDYRSINPEFGTLEDFKALVDKAHALDIYVLIDWVGNASARDCNLVAEHSEWYQRDDQNNLVSPKEGTTDQAVLNYDKKAVREYMIESMEYWVDETGIDGFRGVGAEEVPLKFWQNANSTLQAKKPLFMIAEGDDPKLYNDAFHVTYDYALHEAMNDVAQGIEAPKVLRSVIDSSKAVYGVGDCRMNFTSSQQVNAMNGTTAERFGNSPACFANFIHLIPGIPSLYGGQEAPLNQRLSSFEKDPINWGKFSLVPLYKQLTQIKKDNASLWNGDRGGTIDWVETTDENVLAFWRHHESQSLICVFNLSNEPRSVRVHIGDEMVGAFAAVYKRENRSLRAEQNWKLAPWDFRVYRKVN